MLVGFIRWLRGYVEFDIRGRFPERFINLCLRQGRMLFNAGPVNGVFVASLLLSDYKDIRYLARKAGVRLRIRKRSGVPFLINKYRKRSGVLVGVLLLVITSLLMQCFVWTVEISGIESLSEAYIRTLLKDNGISEGSFKGNLNLHAVERKIMREVEDIGWMSINVTGTEFDVVIEEKTAKPLITPSDMPCNIKAKCDGVIVSMNIKNGSTKLTSGSAVMKDQLIVSGVIENALKQNYFVHADASIIANTEHSVTQKVQLKGTYSKPINTVKRNSLQFLWLNIPLSITRINDEYTSRIECSRVHLNGNELYLGTNTEYCTVYEDYSFSMDKDSAKELLNVKDYMYRLFNLKDCISIETTSAFDETDSECTSYVKYLCTEDIAYKEKIIVN